MSVDALFFHDLKNEIQILKSLIKNLPSENEVTIKISNLVNKLSDRITSVFSKKEVKTLINVNDIILGLSSEYSSLLLKKELLERVSFIANKTQFIDVLNNIIKNSYEAGADLVRIEVKFNSLTIRDNGKCSFETIEKLNSKIAFTTKAYAAGLGSQEVRKFCEKNNCTFVYFQSQCSNPKTGDRGLALRIKFPSVLRIE